MRDSRGRRAVKLCEISAGYTVAWPIVHRTTYGPPARDVPLLEPAVAPAPGAVNTYKREDDAPSHDVILCRETTSPCRTRSAALERPDDMP